MNTLPIQSFLFNNCELKIYGSPEEPLFNCLEVIKVLKCKESNDNKFYRQNKHDPELIVALSIGQGTSTEVVNQYTDT